MGITKILPGSSHSAVNHQLQERFNEAMTFATDKLPEGYVKQIVWDEEGGYPPHSWGYVQYSPRPFKQGYGCDGTTDMNIHFIAAWVCKKLSIDYAAVYAQAYPDEDSYSETCVWVEEMQANAGLLAETVIPEEVTADTVLLMLSDLYQINNRSVVEALSPHLEAKGFEVGNWWLHEQRLRAWKN